MNTCPFCKIDNKDISNAVIEETKFFIVMPSKGALCDGYLLIVPKIHVFSTNALTKFQKAELIELINKYRELFKEKYGKYPIFFEHGTHADYLDCTSSSVNHAHIHVVNHNFLDQDSIMKKLNLMKVNLKDFFDNKNKCYISYISPSKDFYITYNFIPKSQQMRQYIADDLNISCQYNWREYNFKANIINTINTFKF